MLTQLKKLTMENPQIKTCEFAKSRFEKRTRQRNAVNNTATVDKRAS